ncbi:marine proteobacterial sortase target protein [Parahaliea sp. F7430]|uniref:Marine proteobacterial sortase target protein n=1 Tax=Sediminihaliea albiluteola TaxID=2758564 RepID=A0A7W2TVT2_9GAMM|nr:marine proteobacterial sortase target protein [Sediminihaliea albiluteola]MBA6412840.1 marine proteobacterial sortase target protein [Sediminihaliea albiluteola]
MDNTTWQRPAGAYWFVLPALPTLIGAVLALLVISASPARAVPAAEIGAGHMQWHSDGSDSYQAALTQHSKLSVTIAGMVAVVQLEQRFENSTDSWQEGIYSFPLPPEAAVRQLEMQVGERRVLGKVRERQQAKKLYQEARVAGKKAALVEQQRANLFTNRIANIAPGEQVTVRLEYVQPASYVDGEFALRIPTTLTPRYIPGVSALRGLEDQTGAQAASLSVDQYLGWAKPTIRVPDADAVTPLLYPQTGSDFAPLNPMSIDVDLDAGMPLAEVQALYHEMALSRRGDRYQLTLLNGISEMDRDFELRWRPVTGAAPQAAFFTEQVAGQYYGLLMVVPPALVQEDEILPREQIFVIDTSGSMAGEPIEQARQSLKLALAQLRPQDYFNVIAFDSDTRALFNQAMPANRHYVAQASEFVRHLYAGGGTEMLPALERAFRNESSKEEQGAQRLRQVIFITDGAVANEQELFDAIQAQLGHSRLFTVGIGSAPNQWFMQGAADAGRGFSVQVSKIDQVSAQMGQLFERIAAPLAADLSVSWPQQVEAWPSRVADLYRGEPLLQSVHFGDALPAGELLVSGQLAGKFWQQRIALAPQPGGAEQPGVASLWAKRKIASLLSQLAISASEEDIRPAVLDVALTHQLLSPYTSFVAIEEKISRDVNAPLRSNALPNTRPRGQGAQPYAYPNTATTGPANAFLGCFALFIALLIYVMRRPEEDHVSKDS